jgi:hypothetical protein
MSLKFGLVRCDSCEIFFFAPSPFAEQRRIVHKLDSSRISAINCSKEQSEKFLLQVLRKALQPNTNDMR